MYKLIRVLFIINTLIYILLFPFIQFEGLSIIIFIRMNALIVYKFALILKYSTTGFENSQKLRILYQAGQIVAGQSG